MSYRVSGFPCFSFAFPLDGSVIPQYPESGDICQQLLGEKMTKAGEENAVMFFTCFIFLNFYSALTDSNTSTLSGG